MLTDELKKKIQRAYSTLLENKGLKPRYGQRMMIADVARTLTSAQNDSSGKREGPAPICVVEAGTGTGKTIAYAIAAIPVAQALDKTLVISTATIALQEQIVYKDLPDILKHSGLSFDFALAKGRGRYLCLSKLDGVLQGGDANNQAQFFYPDEMQPVVDVKALTVYQDMISALSSGDWDGDRDTWKQELSTPLWSQVTTDHAQCTGRHCPNIRQCYFYKGREQLNNVDVVVTNHDLVLSDLALGGGAILPAPEDTIYIFDEGHHLADKAINHFSQFSRIRSTERWLDQGIKLLAKAAPTLGSEGSVSNYIRQLPSIMELLKQHLTLVYVSLESAINLDVNQRGSSVYHRFENGLVPDELRLQACELAAQFRTMHDLLDKSCAIVEEAMQPSDHAILAADAQVWFPALSMLRQRADANYVLWSDYTRAGEIEEPPRGRWISVVEGLAGSLDFEVSSSPILAANTLKNYLWSRCYAAVVTSATLLALGNFDRFMMRAGTSADNHYAAVPSPFNFAQAGELVVPAMQCDPSDAESHTRLIVDILPTILSESEGSLVLFASKRQMEQVFETLALAWQQRILMQGIYPKQEIISQHRQSIDDGRGSVIFGLASFAEGVDLPGNYCTHVVIAKIPFAVPDQPVESALAEWVESRGGNSFMEITVPDAAVKLVQASGRLLRTETDRGRVTLLDRRIVSRRYGKAMLDSLPPFKRVLQ